MPISLRLSPLQAPLSLFRTRRKLHLLCDWVGPQDLPGSSPWSRSDMPSGARKGQRGAPGSPRLQPRSQPRSQWRRLGQRGWTAIVSRAPLWTPLICTVTRMKTSLLSDAKVQTLSSPGHNLTPVHKCMRLPREMQDTHLSLNVRYNRKSLLV